MGRAHSAAPPAFGGIPSDVSAAARRAASVPEPVSGPLRTSSLPTVAGARTWPPAPPSSPYAKLPHIPAGLYLAQRHIGLFRCPWEAH